LYHAPSAPSPAWRASFAPKIESLNWPPLFGQTGNALLLDEPDIKRERLGRQHEVAAFRRDSRADEARQNYRGCSQIRSRAKISEAEALRVGLEQKATEFTESGAEIYAKT
jgi:hypothetical protein